MGTRSVVAAEFPDGIKGVYVHSDGYPEGPSGMLNTLGALIARDSVDKVITKIVGKPNGWSSLDQNQTRENLNQMYKDGRFLAIPGYGVQFSAKLVKIGGKPYRQALTEYRKPGDGGEAYFYLIKRDGSIDWVEGDWPREIKHYRNVPADQAKK